MLLFCFSQTALQKLTHPDARDCAWSSTSSPVTGSGSGDDCEPDAAGDGTNCSVPVEVPTPESSVNRVVEPLLAEEELVGDAVAAAGAASGAETL